MFLVNTLKNKPESPWDFQCDYRYFCLKCFSHVVMRKRSILEMLCLAYLLSNDISKFGDVTKVWRCITGRNKTNKILGFISRCVTNSCSEVILRLYLALVRPHLDYAAQFWSLYYRKDIGSLEAVQRRMTKMIQELRNLSYKDRLKRPLPREEEGKRGCDWGFQMGKRSFWRGQTLKRLNSRTVS